MLEATGETITDDFDTYDTYRVKNQLTGYYIQNYDLTFGDSGYTVDWTNEVKKAATFTVLRSEAENTDETANPRSWVAASGNNAGSEPMLGETWVLASAQDLSDSEGENGKPSQRSTSAAGATRVPCRNMPTPTSGTSMTSPRLPSIVRC